MIAVQTEPYPSRPLFHRLHRGLPVYRPFLAFRGAQEGLGLMIVQDDSGRPTAIIRKFESPYHMYRHYNRPLFGLGGIEVSESVCEEQLRTCTASVNTKAQGWQAHVARCNADMSACVQKVRRTRYVLIGAAVVAAIGGVMMWRKRKAV